MEFSKLNFQMDKTKVLLAKKETEILKLFELQESYNQELRYVQMGSKSCLANKIENILDNGKYQTRDYKDVVSSRNNDSVVLWQNVASSSFLNSYRKGLVNSGNNDNFKN